MFSPCRWRYWNLKKGVNNVKIGIIGAGKVGISLGHILQKKGVQITGFSSTKEDALALAKSFCGEPLLYIKDNLSIVRISDVIAITTQDRNIKAVAEHIYRSSDDLKGKIFFHTSGSQSIEPLLPLREKGAYLGVLHPLQSFPDVESAIKVLPETYIFIEGDESAISVLIDLAEKIGRKAIRIESEKKVLYHLCAVFVCNLMCGLIYAGSLLAEMIGTGLEPFFPIIKATLRNIEEKGPILSLTGPIVRGDVETIIAHLKKLKEMPIFLEAYRSLSLFALEIAKKRGALDIKTEEQIRDLLKDVLGGRNGTKGNRDS